MAGVANYNGALFKVKSTLGKRVNRHLFWGAGFEFAFGHTANYLSSGLNYITYYGTSSPANVVLISATGGMKYYFIAKRVSPFIGEEIGASYYSLALTHPVQFTDPNGNNTRQVNILRNGGGGRSVTELGFKCYLSKKIGVGFSVSYLFQHFQIQTNFPEEATYVPNHGHYTTQARYYHFLLFNFILFYN